MQVVTPRHLRLVTCTLNSRYWDTDCAHEEFPRTEHLPRLLSPLYFPMTGNQEKGELKCVAQTVQRIPEQPYQS